MAASSPLAPTFYGHIASTQDGLLLFEACLSGVLNHVARRPHDRERPGLIRSGNVFIYEEHSSGIKRWTDGVPWSPSRILGNFLVYRELERPFPPGEKKRAMKRNKRSPIAKTNVLCGGPTSAMNHAYGAVSAAAKFDSASPSSPMQKETERSLIGSLVDSYGFKEGGLVKKTVSVTIGGISHHLVSYYTIADVMNNKFTTPSKDPRFQYITPRPDLITKQNFRTPIDEVENVDGTDEGGIYSASVYDRSGYDIVPQRHMSLPNPPSYAHNPGLYQNYGMNSGAGMLETFPPASSNHGYSTAFGPAPGVYSAAMVEHHSAGGYRESRNSLAAATVTLPRRALTFEQYDSVDSGTSGISTALDEPRHTQSGSYPTPSFYGGLKDATNISRSYPPQRPLPTLNVYTPFERHPVNPYSSSESSGTKENAWPVGNASSGHGHYTSSQQQWASMGAS